MAVLTQPDSWQEEQIHWSMYGPTAGCETELKDVGAVVDSLLLLWLVALLEQFACVAVWTMC